MEDRNAEKEPHLVNALPIGEEAAGGFEPEPTNPTDAWEGGWPQTPREFEALVEMYLDRLVRYAFRRLGNLQDAEDVVQEVFVRAFAEQSSGRRTIARPGPYLYRMAANACTDFFRKRRLTTVPLDEVGVEQMSDKGMNPAQAALAAEELRRAEELVRRLPIEQAEVVRLRVFDELRLHEIAEIVGCSINTVSSRLRYGFRKLREVVSRREEIRP